MQKYVHQKSLITLIQKYPNHYLHQQISTSL